MQIKFVLYVSVNLNDSTYVFAYRYCYKKIFKAFISMCFKKNIHILQYTQWNVYLDIRLC